MANPADKPDPNLSTHNLEPEDEEREELEDINGDGEEEEEYEGEDDDNSLASKPQTREDAAATRSRAESLFRRMGAAPVPVRVHDVIVNGNEKTKDHVIEAEVGVVRQATTLQELIKASKIANYNLEALDIFDSVKITLDRGPPELPGTTNVVINVVETESPLTAQLGAVTKAEARSSVLEGSLKYKNIFGYGDIWDGSLAYGCDNSAEVGLGMYLPRFRGRPTPFTSRVYLSTQDWLKFSSYKERTLGLSLGLVSSKYHDLAYTIAWRNLIDPSQMASRSIRRQLGHNLVSALKYTFRVDQRNSSFRPTRGYSFISTSQIGGLAPDSRTLRFLRQEMDLRYAVPLGYYRAALNFGVSGGITFPWGSGYKSRASYVPERFFLGGNISPVCSLGGPSALWGFKTRGLGPNEPRREVQDDQSGDTYERDFVGGDVAVTAFADLSFDFPLKWFRDRGIHGHVFACTGNMAELSENKYRNFTAPKFLETFRSSVGAGIVVPTSLFRMELNYCHILKKQEHDRAKSGFFLTFSTSS
ncbi:hypothetical protein EUTSA_v10013229mg [Eutrema salsugineum]|uniref:POTRA domain-containing protein n=1 Tax=Eutrema salsugineum TaxID=72664 RepID=V4N4W5_EUTSA|nr:sorting and assembly machinery component 50 homolog B [Eutrema salsugineum]ESQ40466.1 hypothetical protein EUTSA_v10013229mg [Eutrema salsugineum]